MNKLKDILTSKYTYCFVGVIVVWGLSWFLTTLCIGDSQDRGTFGDMFGAVNALFSGLAFAGLIITLIQQRTELELQRNEILQTREEMAHQSAEFKLQNKNATISAL